MNQISFIKFLLVSSTTIGRASTGTYFGTKVTLEKHVNLEKTQKRINEKDKWEKSLKKLKENKIHIASSNNPKSEIFKNFPKEKESYKDLENLCKNELEKVYKIFSIQKIREDISNLIIDLKEYCFENN